MRAGEPSPVLVVKHAGSGQPSPLGRSLAREARRRCLPSPRMLTVVIDPTRMSVGEVISIEASHALLCRQTTAVWTVSRDRWGNGSRTLTAKISRASEDAPWTVASLPGSRNPREIVTWDAAIDAALSIL